MNEPIQGDLINAQQLPPEMLMMKMENEHIMTVAMAKPRDYKDVKRGLKSSLDEFPAAAGGYIYSKPVGKECEVTCSCGHVFTLPKVTRDDVCPRCDKWDHQGNHIRSVPKFIRGLSIRAAEGIRVEYGFNRVSTTIQQLDDARYKVMAIFVDYCAGNVTIDERISTMYYKGRGGSMQKTDEGRYFNITIEADKAKARRNVILQSVPGILRSFLFDYCEKKIDGLLDDKTVDKMVGNFAGKSVLIEDLEAIIGRSKAEGWTKDDRRNLMGLWTALEQDETSAAEIIKEAREAAQGSAEKPPKLPNQKLDDKGSVSADNFMQPSGQAESYQKPPVKTKDEKNPTDSDPEKGPVEPAEENTTQEPESKETPPEEPTTETEEESTAGTLGNINLDELTELEEAKRFIATRGQPARVKNYLGELHSDGASHEFTAEELVELGNFAEMRLTEIEEGIKKSKLQIVQAK